MKHVHIHITGIVQGVGMRPFVYRTAMTHGISGWVLNAGDGEYTGGVVVAAATCVKGLEFDCVIMADAGEKCFADAPLDGRLLYVCLTRPLHELAVLYGGELTPLLREAVQPDAAAADAPDHDA